MLEKGIKRAPRVYFHMEQVHGCIQQGDIIVSINPSCQQNFINVQLVNRLQVPTNNIQST
jgi:hypothetical protein